MQNNLESSYFDYEPKTSDWELFKVRGFLPKIEDFNEKFVDERGQITEAWREFCDDNKVYELFTQEFIVALGTHLSQSIAKYRASDDTPITILEVGAGNGKLTHFLQEILSEQKNIQIIATDAYEYKPPQNANSANIFPVEEISSDDAIAKYRPKIVVCCWMDVGEDLTPGFRACENVEEYLIIGEGPGGCSGDGAWYRPYDMLDEQQKSEVEFATDKSAFVPFFENDGFKVEKLEEISETQICCTDWGENKHSGTWSFTRVNHEYSN